MRNISRDVRYGLLVLRSSPGFTVVAVLTLALGIAVNTTVFSWVASILLHPIPGARDDQRIISLETLTPNGEFIRTSYPDFRDYRDRLTLVSGVTSIFGSALRIGEGPNGQTVWGEFTSGSLFEMLGVRPVAGRFFSKDESADPPATPAVVVLSYHLWQSRFQGDRAAIGKTVRVNQRPLTIIGVAEPGFQGTMTGVSHDLWVPLTLINHLNRASADMLDNRWTRNQEIYARLKPGVSIGQASAEAAARARELAKAHPNSNRGISATVISLSDRHTSGAQALLKQPLRVLMAICGIVLLIVCANVANLLLARSTSRQREFAIRTALGANRATVARQLITESFLLAGVGALAGMLLVLWLGPALVWLLPPARIPVSLDTRFSPSVLGFTVLICAGTAIISSIAPVLYSLRTNLTEALNEGGRGDRSGARSHRLRALLVIGEVALASVALVGAGLFVRTFRAAQVIDTGFETDHVLISRFSLADTGEPVEQQHQFCERLRQRMEGAAGVTTVSYADAAPLGFDTGPWQDIQVEGYVASAGENMRLYRSLIAPGYFNTVGIPVLHGRDFTAQDDRKALPVAIVNQALARRYFAGADPVGRKIRAWGRWLTVVGLVRDAKYHNLAAAPEPYFYAPYRQFFNTGLTTVFFVKTPGDPMQLLSIFRREAARVNPNVDVSEMMSFTDYTSAALYPMKVAASLMTALSALSILLAALGLYSVMAYAVSQRTRELGIRMALGARQQVVLRMLLRQGLRLTVIGLLLGLGVSLVLTRFIAGMLVDVSPFDPISFAIAAGFLLAVSALASYFPARRATKVDPMEALRSD
jgi:predicted permease